MYINFCCDTDIHVFFSILVRWHNLFWTDTFSKLVIYNEHLHLVKRRLAYIFTLKNRLKSIVLESYKCINQICIFKENVLLRSNQLRGLPHPMFELFSRNEITMRININSCLYVNAKKKRFTVITPGQTTRCDPRVRRK